MKSFNSDQKINIRELYKRQKCPYFWNDLRCSTYTVLNRLYRLYGLNHYNLWRNEI